MAAGEDLSGINREVEKLVKNLTQVDGIVTRLKGSTGSVVSSLSSLGSGASVASNSATFSGTTSTSSQQTTSNGMPIARFGGALAAGAMAVGKFGWDVTPGLQDAYAHQNLMFQASFAGAGPVNTGATFGRVRAAFGNTATGNYDQQAAAVLLGQRGMSTTSSSFNRVAGEAGFMSKLTGMSNVQTAAGSSAMQYGGANVASKLMSFGIFTNNLSTGQYGGMGKVIDQLWERWYGSKNAKIPYAVFEADLMGGFLGRDLNYFFGSQPELYQMVLQGLRVKAKAGGMAGIDFSENARGPKSGNALAKKFGMNSSSNPLIAQMGLNSSNVDLLQSATGPLIKGFEDATDQLIKFNENLKAINESSLGQMALYGKGFLETLQSTTQGAAGLNLAMTGLAGLIGGLLGRGGGLGGLLGGGGKHAAPGALSGLKGMGGTLLRGAGGIGAALGGNFLIDALRENTTLFDKGTAPDNIATILASMGVGAGSGALMGGPAGAVIGTLLGLGTGIFKTATDAYALGGTSTSDSINARLSKGEYVINARAAQRIGKSNLDRLNSMGHQFGSAYASPAASFAKGGQVDGDQLGRSANEAVEWAVSSTGRDAKFPGLCDRYVANTYGQAHSGYKNAQEHWDRTPGNLRHPGDTRPPAGALVFWNSSVGGGHGHAAVVTGYNDKGVPLVSTTHLNGGTPTIVPLDTVMPDAYLGWASPYFQGKTASLDGVSGSTITEAAPAGSSATPGESSSAPATATGYAGTLGSAAMYRSLMSNPMSTYMAQAANPMTIFGGGLSVPSALGDTSGSRSASGKSSRSAPKGGGNYKGGGTALLKRLYRAGFRGEKLREAWAIGMRESGGRASAHNTNRSTGDNSYGLFQINMLDDLGPARDAKFRQYVKGYDGYDSLLDPGVNIRAMKYMSNKGSNWDSWVGPQYGKAAEYYSQFDAAASKAGIPGYAHGTDYVARSGTANVHQGEMIIPASQATDFREALREALNGGGRRGDININLTIEKASDEEADRFVTKVIQRLRHEDKQGRLRGR